VDRRPFGATGITVSAVGVGCSRIGGMFSATSSRRDELDLLRRAFDAGITVFDTSDWYSQGQSELLVGQALRSHRAEVVLATKGGYVTSRRERMVAHLKPIARPVVRALGIKRSGGGGGGGSSGSAGPSAPLPQDFRPAYLASAVEGSLRRLGTDYIDIYQLHSPPAAVIAAGEYVPVLDRLKAQGKIRQYGIAADAAEDVASVGRHPSVTSLQLALSVIDQSAAASVLPAAVSAGTGVISRSCFAAGLLVGSRPEDELRAQTPDWEAIVAFRAVAGGLGRSRRELALQFNLGTPGVSVTIVGMSTPTHVGDVVREAAAPPLTDDERRTLLALGSAGR
jgi:aryl-alcohol dehydrogenase-like predicted oxidoreductase